MAAAKRARSRPKPPLEYSILYTATLCLLAAGAVMVYSASSAESVLQNGDPAFFLKRYLMFGALGLLAADRGGRDDAPPRHDPRHAGRAGAHLRAGGAVPTRAHALVPAPLAGRREDGLPGCPGDDRARLRRLLRGGPGGVGAEDLLP